MPETTQTKNDAKRHKAVCIDNRIHIGGKVMKKFTSIAAIALCGAMALAATACSSTNQAADTTVSADEPTVSADVAAPGDVAGFEEFEIGEDQELGGVLNVGGVYFQPVEMVPSANAGLSVSEAQCHIEADIHALADNGLGYGTGDFVPYLSVSYEITDASGNVATSGNFMPMNATDGPHYGANVVIGEAGTYHVKFTIKSPEDAGYLLHVDEATGMPGASFWSEPLVAEWDFEWTPVEW